MAGEEKFNGSFNSHDVRPNCITPPPNLPFSHSHYFQMSGGAVLIFSRLSFQMSDSAQHTPCFFTRWSLPSKFKPSGGTIPHGPQAHTLTFFSSNCQVHLGTKWYHPLFSHLLAIQVCMKISRISTGMVAYDQSTVPASSLKYRHFQVSLTKYA